MTDPVPIRRGGAPESAIERARRLSSEARQTTLTIATDLIARLTQDGRESAELAGLESLPAGMRAEFEQIAKHIDMRLRAMESLRGKL